MTMDCKRVTAGIGTGAAGTTKQFTGFTDRNAANFTPVAYVHLRNSRTGAAYGVAAAEQGIGFGVSGGERSGAWYAVHNAFSASTSQSHRNDCTAERFVLNQSSAGRASLNAFGAGSITFDIDLQFAANELHTVFALGGSSLVGAKVITITEPTSTGSQTVTVTGLGGTPSAILVFSVGHIAPIPGVATDIRMMFGVADGNLNQCVYAGGSNFGSDPTVCAQYFRNDELIAGVGAGVSGTMLSRASLTAVGVSGSDGTFDLNWSQVSGGGNQRLFFALVLTGGQYQVGTFTCPTSTNGTVDVTVPNTPRGVIVFGGQGRTALNTAGTVASESYSFSIGCFDATSSRASHTCYDQHNAPTTVAALGHATDGILQWGDTAANQQMDVSAISSTSFTVKATTGGVATLCGYLAIMDPGSGATTRSYSPGIIG